MKKTLIHTLLRSYSLLVGVIIVFFAGVCSYIGWYQFYTNVERVQQAVAEGLKEEMDYYQGRIRSYFYDYLSDQDRISGLYHYFSMSASEYQVWLLQHPLILDKEIAIQDSVQDIYFYYPFIDRVDIALVDSATVFVSDFESKSGKKVKASDYKAPEDTLSFNLYNPVTSEVIGTAYLGIHEELLSNYIQSKTDFPMVVDMVDSLGRTFYSLGTGNEVLSSVYRISGDLEIGVGVDRQYVWHSLGRLFGFIFLGSGILIWSLLAVLKKVFHHYEIQVTDLVDSIQRIRQEDNRLRIETQTKKQEMHLIATEINQMLDRLDTAIGDMYRLKLAQQDANMRALQAQINPHFLYNTLEFFRMYAVSKQMVDLGDMIYEFSSLLRSSVAQSQTTSLEEELSFCEKHSYICQIRYPKSIAYSYQIAPGCGQLLIPRFIVQPLVENYFIHGVDLKRKDNALSVQVVRHGDDVEILIRDNGKGMSETVLSCYQDLLASRDSQQDLGATSIGIRNVHERLLLYFGDAYQVSLQSKEGQGVTYSIVLKGVVGGGSNHA